MNDEYLWQKTGEDPEIERLENALSSFRYRETVSPEVVVSSKAVEEKPQRWRLSLTLAFASCAALAILAGSWIHLSQRESEAVSSADLVFVSGTENPALTNPPAVETPTVRDRHLPAQPARSQDRKVNRTTASAGRRVKAKDTTVRDNIAALTDEERNAYRQLMLALSISSSKLKIVQDTIDGSGETESPRSTNQR